MKLFSSKAREDKPVHESTGEKSGKRKAKSSPGLKLTRISLVAFLLVALVILGTGYVAYLQYEAQVKRWQQIEAASEGEKIAANLAGRMEALTDLVDSMTHDPVIIQAAQQGRNADSEQLTSHLAAMKPFFPAVVRIRIVQPDELEPDATTTPALSYACLDLVRQSEKGGIPPRVEVHKFGTPDQHIDLVRAINGDKGMIASLVVSLDVGILAKWTQRLLPAGSYLELRQGTDESGLMISSHGAQGLKGNMPMHTARVDGTSWNVHYWQPLEQGITEKQRMIFLGLILVAIVLAGIVIVISGNYADGVVKKDLMNLMALVVELVRERKPRPIAIRLTYVREAVKALEQVYHYKNISIKSKVPEAEPEPESEQPINEEPPPPDPMSLKKSGMPEVESEIQEQGKNNDD